MERAGAWHHVTARGNERRAIFRDDRDRAHFRDLLGEAVGLFGWRLHAYVLMDNHFHLLVETPEANLGRGMQWLNVSYSVWFNRRHQRAGHLFQGRYKAILVEPSAWGLALSRYLHLNPVRVARHGLDKNARRRDRRGWGERPDPGQVQQRIEALRRHAWSSYRAYIGLAKPPAWLRLDLLLQQGRTARGGRPALAYRAYVEQAVRQGLPEAPWEKLAAQSILGGAQFVRRALETIRGDEREQRSLRAMRPRLDLAAIIAAVEKRKGEPWTRFRDRYGDWGRDLVLYLGRRHAGWGLKALGQAAGGMDYMSVSIALHRFGRRLAADTALRAEYDQCQALLAP
jgi:putative transposase